MAGSGESDFVEVEVPSLSYHALLRACCEELEVGTSDVIRLRKLPNIWVRKDRDVQRMREGQELEVVLKNEPLPMTSLLTVNPFSNSSTIPIISLQAPMTTRGDTDHCSLIAALTNEVPHTLADLPGHTTMPQVNGLQ